MDRVFLHLVVILLAFSHLIASSNAGPSTRSQKLLQEPGDHPALGSDTSKINMEEATSEAIDTRMDWELTKDYPVPGSNNRHTPPGRS